jgi:hypothetical protein
MADISEEDRKAFNAMKAKFRYKYPDIKEEFELTLEDYVFLKTGSCVWCDQKGVLLMRKTVNRGYVRGNIVCLCKRCKKMKGNRPFNFLDGWLAEVVTAAEERKLQVATEVTNEEKREGP